MKLQPLPVCDGNCSSLDAVAHTSKLATAGSTRLPSHPPLVLADAGDHVEVGGVERPVVDHPAGHVEGHHAGGAPGLRLELRGQPPGHRRSSIGPVINRSTTGSVGEAIVTHTRPSLPRAMLSG